MTHSIPTLGVKTMKREFAGAALPDERLVPRLESVVELMASNPSGSLAKMAKTEAEREGLYRFLRNDRVEADELLAPHRSATAERAASCHRVLAIHDTTEIRVCDDAELQSWLRPKVKGFIAHASLLVDATIERKPLGVASLETIERAKRARTKKGNGRAMSGNETARLENKEYDRWFRSVAETDALVGHKTQVVHVMDAEADSYKLLAMLDAAGQQFVIRLCKNRNAKLARTGSEWTKVRELLDSAKEFKRTRSVRLSKRVGKRAPRAAKARPAREQRNAELTLAYIRFTIRRPSYLKDLPEQLSFTVARAYEKSPPGDQKPVDWVLLTNLDVSSKAHVEGVIDIYRQRWLIEEYFKALKTGCGIRTRKLRNPHSIYNSLSMFVPFAWKALLLREMAQIEAPATRVFSSFELTVLRAYGKKLKKKFAVNLSARDALYFLAETGGYRPSKTRPPGWSSLIAGLQGFEAVAEGWRLSEM